MNNPQLPPPQKNPTIATILELFSGFIAMPGLGWIYAGRRDIGLTILAGYWGILITLAVFDALLGIGITLFLCFWYVLAISISIISAINVNSYLKTQTIRIRWPGFAAASRSLLSFYLKTQNVRIRWPGHPQYAEEFRQWKEERAKQKMLALSDLQKLSPGEFEEHIAFIFNKMGYNAQLRGNVNASDNGVDIEARRDGEYVVIQCKRYSNTISQSQIRDFVGTVYKEGADKGIFVTTSSFSESAKEFAKGIHIELAGPTQIIEWQKMVQKIPTTPPSDLPENNFTDRDTQHALKDHVERMVAYVENNITDRDTQHAPHASNGAKSASVWVENNITDRDTQHAPPISKQKRSCKISRGYNISMVQPPKIGDIVKMRSWHGVVLDVFRNEAGKTILRVQTVRNLFRRLNPEFIEFDLAPDMISLATVDDLQLEIDDYQRILNNTILELVDNVRQREKQGLTIVE